MNERVEPRFLNSARDEDTTKTELKRRALEKEDGEQLIRQTIKDIASRSGGLVAAAENDEAEFNRSLASALNQMTTEMRESISESVHGVEPLPIETEEMVRAKLHELQECIRQLPRNQKTEYERAMQNERERAYITCSRYQLQFLRAESFNAPRAAERLVLNCQTKVKYFGKQTVGRPLSLNDLSKDELKAMKNGSFSLLPRRDRSGRLVVFHRAMCVKGVYEKSLSFYKALWYALMSAVEDDEETQKRGIVMLVWWLNGKMCYENGLEELCSDIAGSWLPIKAPRAIHICINPDSPLKRLAARFAIAISPDDLRFHIRTHEGSRKEVEYQLSTFGIIVEDVPVTSTGAMKTKEFQKWIERRQNKEDILMQMRSIADPSPAVFSPPIFFLEGKIDLPTNLDVLLGVGKPVISHLGNKTFRNIVEILSPRYGECNSPYERNELVHEVILHIKKVRGRFLKRNTDDDWWEIASDLEAREKTGKLFKNYVHKGRKKRGRSGSTGAVAPSASPHPDDDSRRTTRIDRRASTSPLHSVTASDQGTGATEG